MTGRPSTLRKVCVVDYYAREVIDSFSNRLRFCERPQAKRALL
jgi:hypothetical protein